MSLEITAPDMGKEEVGPRLLIIGLGGSGCNGINNMIDSALAGVEFIAMNTDAQSLNLSKTPRRIRLGHQRLGAGGDPEVGKKAAEEVEEEIRAELEGSHMVFIAAGMGGGTGTGAAPVIARIAKEMGILTVGVVTKPFDFEGRARMRTAEAGLKAFQEHVDTLIVIPNQNLFALASSNTTFAESFRMADDVLQAGVRGVTDLMVQPGLINLDFADVRAVMSGMGQAMMGTGIAEGSATGPNDGGTVSRAARAAEDAISNPLLDGVSMSGARGVLINITGGDDMTLMEVDEAASRIRSEVDEDAFIIFGASIQEEMNGKIRVTVVATGMQEEGVEEEPAVETAVMPEPFKAEPSQVGTSQAAPVQGEPSQANPVQADSTVVPGLESEAPAVAESTETMETDPRDALSAAMPPALEPDMEADYVPLDSKGFVPPPPAEAAVAPDPFAEAAFENTKTREGGLRQALNKVLGGKKAPQDEADLFQSGADKVDSKKEELDLELPAFLRRQAN